MHKKSGTVNTLEIAFLPLYLFVQCTVQPVYKGHSREPEIFTLSAVALYIQVKIICTIH